jgi:hypothetical protein
MKEVRRAEVTVRHYMPPLHAYILHAYIVHCATRSLMTLAAYEPRASAVMPECGQVAWQHGIPSPYSRHRCHASMPYRQTRHGSMAMAETYGLNTDHMPYVRRLGSTQTIDHMPYSRHALCHTGWSMAYRLHATCYMLGVQLSGPTLVPCNTSAI